MPTNRRRRVRGLVDRNVPEWAVRLLETGEQPAGDTDAGSECFGWMFLDEPVPGLPPSDELLWSPDAKLRIRPKPRGCP
jgi:hypothetical protein